MQNDSANKMTFHARREIFPVPIRFRRSPGHRGLSRHGVPRVETRPAAPDNSPDRTPIGRIVGGMCCGPADAVKKPGKLALAGLFVPAF